MKFKGNTIILEKHSSTINKNNYHEMTVQEFVQQEQFTAKEQDEFYSSLSYEALTTNVHFMISQESYTKAFEIIDDMSRDSRLKNMNAIVFLSLKQKGGGKDFKTLTTEQYTKLVNYALDKGVRFGFDSCGAHRFLEAVKDHKNYDNFKMMAEPCESSCFSSYINAKGEYFACSFTEGHKDFPEGIDVLEAEDFVKDVWHAKGTTKFRDNLLKMGRHCPLYKI